MSVGILFVHQFWERVDRSAGPDKCWPWLGSRNKVSNYGTLKAKQFYGTRTPLYTHRIAWELSHGKIPTGLQILHSCDNPPCCNPSHLGPGTHQQNMKEAAERGRMASGQRNGMSRTSKARRKAV